MALSVVFADAVPAEQSLTPPPARTSMDTPCDVGLAVIGVDVVESEHQVLR